MTLENGTPVALGATGCSDKCHAWTADKSEPTLSLANSQAQRSRTLAAELTGSDTCAAGGITVTAYAPVLALCRSLRAAGIDPDTALDVHRGATLALRIRSIGEAAGLTVRDDNRGTPRFVAYRPGPAERVGIACGKAPPCV
jgi:hypothetical protein